MGCFIALFALVSPRLAIFALWIFTSPNLLSRAFDEWWVPVAGFLFLPWTTLVYAVCWSSGDAVRGFDWFLVGFAFLVDIASYAEGRRSRRH